MPGGEGATTHDGHLGITQSGQNAGGKEVGKLIWDIVSMKCWSNTQCGCTYTNGQKSYPFKNYGKRNYLSSSSAL